MSNQTKLTGSEIYSIVWLKIDRSDRLGNILNSDLQIHAIVSLLDEASICDKGCYNWQGPPSNKETTHHCHVWKQIANTYKIGNTPMHIINQSIPTYNTLILIGNTSIDIYNTPILIEMKILQYKDTLRSQYSQILNLGSLVGRR